MFALRSSWIQVATLSLLVVAGVLALAAQPPGRGPRGARGRAADPVFAADRDTFHFLLEQRALIQREIKNLENGVETTTTSDDAEVAAAIRRHVSQMERRVEKRDPIHRRDPLFDEVFRHADKIRFERQEIPGGVRVRETSADDYVVKLIQAHAQVVSRFLREGHAEVRRNHAVPQR